MIDCGMIAELLTYAEWARERLMLPISELADEQLDQPFEMGTGSVRATLRHIYFAEWIWAERLGVPGCQALPRAESLNAAAELAGNARALTDAYRSWLRALPSEALQRPVTYVDLAGKRWTNLIGDALLHVCNHGVHHRTQALNMMRHLGRPVPAPGIDYIFMRLEPGPEPPALTIPALRRFYAYGDWATGRVLRAAEELTSEQLDQPFDIGAGTLRATLRHIRDAEQWWFENWTRGPSHTFPTAADRPALDKIRVEFEETAQRRNEFLAGLSGAEELRRPVTGRPRPNVSRTFPLGVTMLQLCLHGTHHRAQAINMLRRLGRAIPGVDYIGFARETGQT